LRYEGLIVTKSVTIKIALTVFLLSASLHAQWITGHYESQNGVEPVSSIPWSKYTHIVHFAAATDGAGGVLMHWLSQSEINQLIAARPAGKKVIVCIQDNGSNLNAFTQSTAPGTINTFVNNIVNFVNSNGYDGVDIDWEINVNGAQYAQLFRLLRAAMPGKTITTDMNNDAAAVSAATASAAYLDQVNIMCYDMDTPGNGYSWYNDALLQNGNTMVMTCDWRVNSFLNAGVPAGKIGVGLPFYGRRWQGVTQALVSGTFTVSTVLYNQLAADTSRWQPQYQHYDSAYKSNFLSIPSMNEFVSYSGPQQMQDAAAWMKAKGFGGAMTFSLYYEYLSGQSGDARYPLSTALYSAVFGSGSGTVTPPPPPTPPVVSGGSPAGALSYGTTQATMSVSTNENATCKYAAAAGTAYSAMPYTFATTGGTSHSVVLTGLSSGSTYNYYVRCADTAGTADTADYPISFSIASSSASSPAPAALAVSASPVSGSGASQTFTFQVSDPGGYAAVTELDAFFGVQVAGTNNCRIQYDGGSTLYMENDAANGWLQGALGSSSTLQNSQCSVNLANSSASGSGFIQTVKLAVSFAPAYAGTRNIFAFAADSAGSTVGWSQLGSWTVTTAAAAPVVSSGSPSGSLTYTITQTTMSVATNIGATCKYATASGTSYSAMPYTFATTGGTAHSILLTGLRSGTAYAYYVRCSGTSGNVDTSDYPVSFSIAAQPAPPALSGGSPAGALTSSTTQTTMSAVTNENATCKYATTAGTAFSAMPYTFATTGRTSHSVLLTGLQSGSTYNYYVRCADPAGIADTADYPISFSVAQAAAPTALTISATPKTGAGSSQTFAFQVNAPGGYSSVQELDVFFGTQIGGTKSCRVQYNAPNTLYLQQDNGSSWVSGTLGTSTVLQNSQCSVNLAASAKGGSGYAWGLKVALSFKSAYKGARNIYGFAADTSGRTVGWLTLGTWTVQ
jgi:hypothetical protein